MTIIRTKQIAPFTSTGTVEMRLKQVDQMISFLRSRMRQTVVGLVPFTIIDHFCEEPAEDGVLARTLIPIPGKLLYASFFIEQYLTGDEVPFEASIKGLQNTSKMVVSTRQNFSVHNVGFDVAAGDRIRIRVLQPQSVRGVWVSAMFEAAYKDLSELRFSWEQVMEVAEKDDADVKITLAE